VTDTLPNHLAQPSTESSSKNSGLITKSSKTKSYLTKRHDQELEGRQSNQKACIESFIKSLDMWDSAPPKGLTAMAENCQLSKAAENLQASKSATKLCQSAIGSTIYAMLDTRPDIVYAVASVSRFASNPRETHCGCPVDCFFLFHRSSKRLSSLSR
jgi:hypothetical protein